LRPTKDIKITDLHTLFYSSQKPYSSIIPIHKWICWIHNQNSFAPYR